MKTIGFLFALLAGLLVTTAVLNLMAPSIMHVLTGGAL